MAHVITGKVRLSYPNLFKAKAFGNSTDAKYSASFLIPKSDTATVAKIKAAIEEAKAEGKDTKWKGRIPTNMRSPLRDGDAERAADHPEYAGMWFINATSGSAPKLYDREHNEILDPEELYPGCWVRADINFNAYSYNGNNGVGAYISSVLKFKDAERFAGYSASASAYDDGYEDDEDLM